MASRPKSGRTGNQRSTARSRKPATIDLTAKEVEAEKAKPAGAAAKTAGTAKSASTAAKPASTKTASSSKSPEFGRAAKTSENASTAKAPEGKADTAAKAAKSPDKPVEEEPSMPASGKAGGGIISGLVGAVVAVAGLGAIGQFENARNIPLIGSLYQTGSSETAGAVSGSEFSELQSRVAELATQADTRQTIDLDPVNAKIAELETAIKAMAQTGSDGGSTVDSGLTGRLDVVEAGLGELKQALANINATAENAAGAETGLAQKINTLDARLASVEEAAGQNPSDTEPFVTIRQRLDGLAGQISEVQAKSSENAEGLASLASQSTELKDTVANVQASEKVARSVAVNALATAIENDDPLTLPIASLEALVGELPETKRLSELAASGIPTVKELATELDEFANGIQNPTGVSEDAGLSDKFWANAQSLVSFRSTGPREGSDPLAILSRVKDAVENDNLAGADAEWRQLPAEIRVSGETWQKRLAVRTEAYALQKEISSKLASQAG